MWLGGFKFHPYLKGVYSIYKGSGLHAVKKLNNKDLVKIIKGFRFVIININFLSIHYFIYLLVFIMINLNSSIIYYDKSSPFNL
jgi:uncharacterized membrane protein